MRNVTIVLAVAAVLALAGQAQGAIFDWDNSLGDGLWHTIGAGGETNWNRDNSELPGSSDDAWIRGGRTATFSAATGNVSVYRMAAGYSGIGTFNQTGGSLTVGSGHFYISESSGTGTYNLSGGTLITKRMYVEYDTWYDGNSATWNITNSPSITISQLLQFGKSADLDENNCILTAVTGTVIHMTGSQFENMCQNDGVTGLAGLNNITFIFKGGLGDVDTFEVGGENVGCIAGGLSENFALEGLALGTGADTEEGNIQLVDTHDNHVDTSGKAEALYVETLTLNDPDSVLDLNGKWLYYENLVLANGATIANVVTGAGATGGICEIPEPATMTLLGLGGIGVLLKRRRKSRA